MGLARLVGSRGICHKASQKRLFGSNCDCKLHACVVARGKAVSETFLTGNLLGDTRGLLLPFRRRDEATRTEGRSNLSVTSRCSSLLSPFFVCFCFGADVRSADDFLALRSKGPQPGHRLHGAVERAGRTKGVQRCASARCQHVELVVYHNRAEQAAALPGHCSGARQQRVHAGKRSDVFLFYFLSWISPH